MGLTAAAAAFAAVALGLGAIAGGAQETVRSVRFEAEVAASGSAQVRVEYELDVPPGPTSVPFDLLGFDAATTDGFELDGVAVSLEPASGSRLEGVAVAVGAASGTTVVARYVIAEAVALDDGTVRGHLPLLTVAWQPDESPPDFFRAELRVPAAWAISDGFPTGLAEVESDDADVRTYRVSLAVAPAVVSFRGRTDGRRALGLPFALDVLAGLLVGGVGVAGWRHLRGVARRARTPATEAGP